MVSFGQRNKFFALVVSVLLLASCAEDKPKPQAKPKSSKPKIVVPQVNADSAFRYIENQLSFGPRTNNSKGHEACGDYLISFFKDLGLNIEVQKGTVKGHDGKKLRFRNIIAQHNPHYATRVFVSAHWDTRPWADEDQKRQREPILGANDGASGVALLMELARIISQDSAKVGIDFILWDAEDYGTPGIEDSYCLGSQYWSNNKLPLNYRAKYGINLDMVGGTNGNFPIEEVSSYYAGPIVDKVWSKAYDLGYGKYFPKIKTGAITDDHYYINTMAKIPCIDIIHKNSVTEQFHPSWHTHADNMDAIDKNTLKAVGQTVLGVVYDEILR
ncbi:M28 family peptidase [Flavobacteriales bacterium]|nr:M28 family peptidase [Flavobacteriales bacterium]